MFYSVRLPPRWTSYSLSKFSSSHFNIIAKDYITGLMQLDPEVRWSSREALEHPWYVGSWEWGRPVAGHGAELHSSRLSSENHESFFS